VIAIQYNGMQTSGSNHVKIELPLELVCELVDRFRC